MEHDTIVVKHPLLKKVVGWLETLNRPLRALLATMVIFLFVGLAVLTCAFIVVQFGPIPLLFGILFLLVWLYIWVGMD